MTMRCAQELCSIASDQLQAVIRAQGAELCSLRTTHGSELLWDGDPSVWGRQAPNLFPVVGALKDGILVHQGTGYPMPRHGFARDCRFEVARLTRQSCTLVLRDDATTRAHYPFPFELRITFAIHDAHLVVHYDVNNPGDIPLPASLGAHPAFRWPLLPETAQEAHLVEFEQQEPAPLRRLDAQGLLDPETVPSPVGGHTGRMLTLKGELFQQDALVFDQLKSRAVRFYAPTTPVVEVAWEGFRHLGLWSKPGAGFLCIEPWHGHASPAGFQGEFSEKPGVFTVAPGACQSFAYAITVYD